MADFDFEYVLNVLHEIMNHPNNFDQQISKLVKNITNSPIDPTRQLCVIIILNYLKVKKKITNEQHESLIDACGITEHVITTSNSVGTGFEYALNMLIKKMNTPPIKEYGEKISKLKIGIENSPIDPINKKAILIILNYLQEQGKITDEQYNLLIDACGIQPASQSQYRQYNYQKS